VVGWWQDDESSLFLQHHQQQQQQQQQLQLSLECGAQVRRRSAVVYRSHRRQRC